MWSACTFLLVCLTCSLTPGYSFTGQNTPPVFEFSRDWVIPENESVGTRVSIVRTRDAEQDPIEYGIEPAATYLDGSNFFRIDKQTGEVFLASPLTGQAGNDFYLFITAFDGHQTAKIEVYVRVVEANSREKNEASGSAVVAGFPLGINGSGHPLLPGGRLPYPPSRPFPPRPRPPLTFAPAAPHPASSAPFPPKIPQKDAFPPSPPAPPIRPASPTASSSATHPTTKSSMASTLLPISPREEPVDKAGPRHPQGSPMMSTILPIIVALGLSPFIGFAFWLLHKRCQRKEESLKPHKKIQDRLESDLSDDLTLGSHPSALYQHRTRRAVSNRYESGDFNGIIPEHHKWEFPRHHLRFTGILGEGCFGQVWKCEALNICGSEGTTTVAVKTLKENASEKEKKDLLSELEVMKLLEPHPNVVTLLGCCTDRDPIFLIMEFVAHGKLQSYLRESRAERFYGNLHGSSRQLTSRDLTSFAYQVAKGMEFLSSKGIIHRDLAARNILVGENKTCKVADFGFARDVIANHVYERKSEGRLPIRWMAPESLFDNIFTTKTDVWSFGILMWEIVTLGSTPYPGMAAAEVMRKVRDKYRLEKPEHCKREMYNIMYYCWDSDPAERPSFSELVRLLDKLLISENEYIELDRFPDHSYYNITNLSGEKL